MKKIFKSMLALSFPWIILFMEDNPGGAFVALVLQATGIGWIPASIWAWQIVHKPEAKINKKSTESESIDSKTT